MVRLACFALLVMLIQANPSTTEKGFVTIFNGKSLDGWDGDSVYWRVEDGAMVGEVMPSTILQRNSFIIWRKGVTNDFELKLEYKVSRDGNSGINYRSEDVANTPYALKGYQCDIDGLNKYTGQNYEERGRTFLALPGQKVILENGKQPRVIDSTVAAGRLKAQIRDEGWNSVHLVVIGNRLLHYVNGILMSDVTDKDVEQRKMTGVLGVQVHVGPPMKICYRNIRLKVLKLHL